jgi:O-antigen ligase
MGYLLLFLLAFFTFFEQTFDYELKLIFLASISSGLYLLSLREQKNQASPFLALAFFGYLLTSFLTIFVSVRPYLSLLKNFEYLSYFLLVMFLISVFKNLKAVNFQTTGIITIGALASLYGIREYLSQSPLNPMGHLLRQPLGWHTAMAGFLILLIPISLARLIESSLGKRKRELIFFFLASIVLIEAFLLTYSRAAFLSLLPGIGFFFILLSAQRVKIKRVSKILLVLVFLTLILFWFLKSGYGTGKLAPGKLLTTQGYVTNVQRIATYKTAFKMIADRPFLGGGAGTFADLFRKYQSEPWFYSSYAHNQYLETGAEAGLVALILFLLIVSLPFYLFFRQRKNLDQSKAVLAGGLAAGMGSFLILNALTSNFNLPASSLLFWLEFSFLIALTQGEREKMNPYLKQGLTAISLIVLVFSILLTWHYVSFKRITKLIRKNPQNEILLPGLAQELNQLYKTIPNTNYLLWEAQIGTQLGNNRLAIEKLLQANKIRPYNPEPLFRAAQLEYEAKGFTNASSYLEKILEFNPYTNTKYHLLSANTYLEIGEKEKAKKVLEDALSLYFPKNRSYHAYKYLFDAYGDTKNLETMEKLLEALE